MRTRLSAAPRRTTASGDSSTIVDRFARLLERSREARSRGSTGAVVGVAPHSLRAVTPEELAAVAALAPDGPDPHPCRRADEGGRGLPRLVGRAAGRVAARQCAGRPALVPDPRHPHDRGRDRRAGAQAAPSPASARSPRPISATALFAAPPLPRRRRPLRRRLRFQRADRRCRRVAPARIFAAPGAPRAQCAGGGRRLDRARAVRRGARRRRVALGAGPARIAAGASADLVSLDAEHPVACRQDAATPSSTPGFSPMAARSIASGCAAANWSSGGRHSGARPSPTRFARVDDGGSSA